MDDTDKPSNWLSGGANGGVFGGGREKVANFEGLDGLPGGLEKDIEGAFGCVLSGARRKETNDRNCTELSRSRE